MLPWLVLMLALTCGGSVGTLPVRGGLTFLLAASAAGYWQFAPRSAGAANGGELSVRGGGGAEVGGVGVSAEAVLLFEPLLVTTTVATTAADHQDALRPPSR